ADVRMASGAAALLEPPADRLDRRGPLLVVGGIHVYVERLAAGGLDPGLDLLDVGERGPEVEVDADDPVAVPGEGEGGGLAHPARATENERPALAIVGHGVSPRDRAVGQIGEAVAPAGRAASLAAAERPTGRMGAMAHNPGRNGPCSGRRGSARLAAMNPL